MRYGQQVQNARQEHQASLFGDDDEIVQAASRPVIQHAVPWSDVARLERERELVGIFISGNPLDPYYVELNHGVTCTLARREELQPAEGMEVSFGGMVIANTPKTTRKGEPMQIVKLEDFTGTTEIVLFGRNIHAFGALCQPGTPILVRGLYTAGRFGGEIRFRLDSVIPLDDVRGQLVDGVVLRMADDNLDRNTAAILNDIIAQGERDLAEDPRTAMGSLSFDIYSPRYNRRLRMRSVKRFPLTRAGLQALDLNDIDYELHRVK